MSTIGDQAPSSNLYVVRFNDIPSAVDTISQFFTQSSSLLGGAPRSHVALLRWAAQNCVGSTVRGESSPRFGRDGGMTLKAGFGGVAVVQPLDVQNEGKDANSSMEQEKNDQDKMITTTIAGREGLHRLLACVLFHYDGAANIATVYEICTCYSFSERKSRSLGIRALKLALENMSSQLDKEAVLNGQLAGCNAILVVSRTADDPHRVLHALQIHLLDFPLERLFEESGSFSIGVVVSTQVQIVPLVGGSRYFVPAIVLERFLRLQTQLAELMGLYLKEHLQTQLAKLAVRSKIPTMPWSKGLSWMVISLRDDYDASLLRSYKKTADEVSDNVPSFDVLEKWLQEEENEKRVVDVVVVLSWVANRSEFDLVGGIFMSYFVHSNTAIIHSWFLARPGKSHNRRHEAKRVLDALSLTLKHQAISNGHIAGLDGIFVEASLTESKSVLNMCSDHMLLQKLGFRKLQIDYLFPDGENVVGAVLVVLVDETTPRSEFDPRVVFLPQTLVMDVVCDRWGESEPPEILVRQVRLQEEHGIPLLELPWSGVTGGVLVDLFDDFDNNLAMALHKMLPPDSVEPFHVWRSLLADDDSSPLTARSMAANRSWTLREKSNVFELHALVPLECKGKEVQNTGGLLIHYYPSSNSAVVSHIIAPSDRPLEPLLAKAREIVDRAARERGFLSGCNALFVEIAAEHLSTRFSREEFHQTLRDAGFRMVGLRQYEAPIRTLGPWSRHQETLTVPLAPHTLKGSILLAFLGEFVPVDAVIGDFLPANVIRGFVSDRWKGAFESGLVQETPESNPAFVQMQQSLSAMTKVPLQDLPWSQQSSEQWIFVNLGRHYDEELLTAWYNTVFKPNFPLEDEVESLDSFMKGLLAEPNDDDAMLLEIILAVRWEGKTTIIGGGVVYEYYYDSNCGLISFLVVSRAARGQGLSRVLVEKAAAELDVLSVEDGGALAGCNAIFLETNSAQAITMEQDVMDPRLRHLIYHNMGFKLVDFQYVMPPLGAGMPKVYYLLLLVYTTPKIPSEPIPGSEDSQRYIPGILLQRFFHDQWKHALQYGRLLCQPEQDPDYSLIMSSLQLTDKIYLREYPWVKFKEWTLINMREYPDEDLLKEVLAALYEVYPVAKKELPEKKLRESLEKELEPGESCYHIVVALEPPAMDAGSMAKAIEADTLSLSLSAVLVLYYSPRGNFGRIVFDFCCLKHGFRLHEQGSEVLTDLVSRGVEILQKTAVINGHMAGCSAVLVNVDLGEERFVGDASGMVPILTRATSSKLGFLECRDLHMSPNGTDTLLVLDTDDIPKDELGNKVLPSRLLADYVMEIAPRTSKVRDHILSRKLWQVRAVKLDD